jgi:hypothetical protein
MRLFTRDRAPAPFLLGAAAALLVAVGHPALASAAGPVSPSARTAPPGGHCIGEDGASARAAGDSGEGDGEEQDDAAPEFSAGFYRDTFTIDASVDGVDGQDLPVSIEQVCNVSRTHAREASQLAGADGVALLASRPSVWMGRARLSGAAAAAALDGADTATLRVRLAPRRQWREDEDGNPVPTFSTRRVEITD